MCQKSYLNILKNVILAKLHPTDEKLLEEENPTAAADHKRFQN